MAPLNVGPDIKSFFKLGSKITVSYGQPISAEKIKGMEDDDFAAI